MTLQPDTPPYDLLRLTLTPGLGPILIKRAIAHLSSPAQVCQATPAALQRVEGIGSTKANNIAAALANSANLADAELQRAQQHNARIITLYDNDYPPLLRLIPDPPPILYIKGTLQHNNADRYPVAIVGSRSCSHYGREQAQRFAQTLANSGLTIVSGGARGIDTAAHQGALRTGRTIAVLGSGLAHPYPPENTELFQQIYEQERGAVVSALPIDTPPEASNFPARNRIISGLSLGVLVIEAGRKSGALITARIATEDHNRDVFALPARVDSASAEGSLALLRDGHASITLTPADIITGLEHAARHLYQGNADAILTNPATTPDFNIKPTNNNHNDNTSINNQPTIAQQQPKLQSQQQHPLPPTITTAGLTPQQTAIVEALTDPLTIDELLQRTGLDPAQTRAAITILEIRGRIKRQGPKLTKT